MKHHSISTVPSRIDLSRGDRDEPKPTVARRAFFKRLESGAAVARFDAGDIFWLSRALADLFETLLKDPRENDGALIDLKERAQVQLRLGRLAHKTVGRGTVRTRMTRLRDTLEAAGYSRSLVECSHGGMRVRLTRGAQ